MKDHETLGTHNIKDGLTVHLVIKASSRTNEVNNAPRPPGNVSYIFSFLQLESDINSIIFLKLIYK